MTKLTREQLIASIDALLELDKNGALVPHGMGALARELFERVVPMLEADAERADLHQLTFDGDQHVVYGTEETINRIGKALDAERSYKRGFVGLTPTGQVEINDVTTVVVYCRQGQEKAFKVEFIDKLLADDAVAS